jgi:hypothetical protein
LREGATLDDEASTIADDVVGDDELVEYVVSACRKYKENKSSDTSPRGLMD